MSTTPRDYLLSRFRSDAETLRQRAASLAAGAPAAGPDASTSRLMAAACDDIVRMLEALPEPAPSTDRVTALHEITALIPLFEARATAETAQPAVRAVFSGAATRVREILAAESRA